MSDGESAHTLAAGAGGTERRPKWYLLYYFLALLDVATVLASLTLNHHIMQIYVNSVATSQEWEKRETEYARLSELANAVNAPGNDVFDSRDAAGEARRFHAALLAYDAHLLRAEMIGNVTPAERAMLMQALDGIQQAMDEMVAEAELIFSYFAAGHAERAGERMATMDRRYAGVLRSFAHLFSEVRTIRRNHFEEQLRLAGWLKRLEHLIMALTILMIGGALVYGSRISRTARNADAQRSEYIEALRRARAEADEANQAKSRFLATVSHEIRTPLNSMFLALDLLEDPQSNDERKSCLALARSSGARLKRLIDDLLDLSRIEAGRVDFECLRFDVKELVHELLAPYVGRASLKGVSLAIRIAPEVPPAVEGDPTRFGQIITNLVENAVKFTPAGSIEVSVSLRPGARFGGASVPLRVAVRDTGIGLAPAEQAHIFDDFVQGDECTAAKYGGIGLGLGIVRRLVRLMNGELGVSSTPGAGSTFWFEVELAPSRRESPAAAAPGEPADWQQRLVGRHVLLVEDVPESSTLTAAVLGQLGMKVDVAVDGAAAVTAAGEKRYDAILMDIGLPVMDGFEATRRIRERERAEVEVPIIALTAQVSEGIFEQCLDAGMDDYLAKPVTRESMIPTLWRWLEPAPCAEAARAG